jgi:hypothetical protein
MDPHLAVALRLPTFHAGQGLPLKRAIVVADRNRVIHQATLPVIDIPTAIHTALDTPSNLAGSAGVA